MGWTSPLLDFSACTPGTVSDAKRIARRLGWNYSHNSGDHHVYDHDSISGPLVIPGNDYKTLAPGTESNIRKQLGIK